MKRNFLIFVLLIHFNQSTVVLSQNESHQENKENSRKLYQMVQQTQQYVPIQQPQPIYYQQPQTITPVYQNIIPTLQTTPVQIQQQPQLQPVQQIQQIQPQQNQQQLTQQKKHKKKRNRKLEIIKKNKWYNKQIKKMMKVKKFAKLINSKESYKRKLQLLQSEDTSPKKKRKLWGWIRRIFRAVRRFVRRVVRSVRRIFRPKPKPKSAAYYARKYPMPKKKKIYRKPGAELTDVPEECILFMEFQPMYYISVLRKLSFRINFSSNCFYSKDLEFYTSFHKTRHLNLDSHPTEVKLFLFENFVEMDYKEPKLIDDTDIMVSKKYEQMNYKHKDQEQTIDLNYKNSVFIKPDVRNTFSKYNFQKIENKDTLECKAKSRRIYRPGLPESVFWEAIKLPVLQGHKRYKKEGFWVRHMGKYYEVQKSKLVLHPYNTKFFIKAPYYIPAVRMKKGPYYDNYIRLPKGDMMVKYSGENAFIKYPTKSGNSTTLKVIQLTKYKNAFYYITKKQFTYPVLINENRQLVKKRLERKLRGKQNRKTKQNADQIRKQEEEEKRKREIHRRKMERRRKRRNKQQYSTFKDLRKLRRKIGVVKTEILCYLT